MIVLLAAQALSDCSGMDRWPAAMAIAQLKNAGIVQPEAIDFGKSSSLPLASQPLRDGRIRQVFLVTLMLEDGRSEQAVVVNDATREECSGSEPRVLRVTPAAPPAASVAKPR